jgi:hypothetical protein
MYQERQPTDFITTGRTVLFEPEPVFIRFYFYGFSNSSFFTGKVVSPASNRQPGGPGLCIYVPQGQGDPVLLPGTGYSFRRFLGLAGGGVISLPVAGKQTSF